MAWASGADILLLVLLEVLAELPGPVGVANGSPVQAAEFRLLSRE